MFWFIIGFLIFLVGIVCSFLFFTQEIIPIFGWLLIVIGGGIMCYNGNSIKVKNQPQAIDVYRGRTTLEITWKDSVAVDSIVVWR